MKVNLQMKAKLFSLIIALVLLLPCFSAVVFAAPAENERIKASMTEFLDPSGEIIGVSSKGEWDDFPENSIPAIIEASKTDIDFVAVDIKRALCGSLILFSDDTTERMLDSEEVFSVEYTEYSTLSAYKLRNSCGGKNEKVTDYSIPTLEDAIVTAKENDIPLILRCSAEIIPQVSEKLYELDAMSMCIIMTDGNKKDIAEVLALCTEKPYIIGSKKGNVIFNIVSFVNALEDMDAAGVELKTVNRYGINYYPSLVGMYAKKLRVISDPTTPEISGYREDSEKWWNDLISRGYSVIITDHAELFCEYKERTEKARERLQSLYDKYVTNHTLPDFKDDVLSDLKKAYTDAVAKAELLLADNSSALQELNDCYSQLNKAANDINKNFSALEDGSAETTITAPRIILCVAAVAVVIIVQIYFFKRRKKAG